jgi:hypothetical protein
VVLVQQVGLLFVGFCGSWGGASGFSMALTQLDGSPARWQRADHSESRKSFEGRLHDLTDSNMWSRSTKLRAYAQ